MSKKLMALLAGGVVLASALTAIAVFIFGLKPRRIVVQEVTV